MRVAYTATSDDFRTQGYGATRYARVAASLTALALDAAGVPGVLLRETVRHLYAPYEPAYGRGWRGERFPLDRTASTFDVLIPPGLPSDRLPPCPWSLADRARLAWALGGNAYVVFGGWPGPVGAPDPLAFAPPTDQDRARLARLPALRAETVTVPYTPPPPPPPETRGCCPAGHGFFPAITTGNRGRWARWHFCETCRRYYDDKGFGLGLR